MKKKIKGLAIFALAVMLISGQMMGGNAANAQVIPKKSMALKSIVLPSFPDNRLAGADRFKTAAEIAKSLVETLGSTSGEAILVNGLNYPDALSAAPLAAVKGAPILLSEAEVLPSVTLQALKDLKVNRVTIVGGTGVISTKVENIIKSQSITVERIAGLDRFQTSVKVAERIKAETADFGDINEVIVASGMSFADALSISPIAASHLMPILLTDTNAVPASVQNFINANTTIEKTYVIGGTGVITDGVMDKLPTPLRLGGVNRFDTNLKVLQYFNDSFYYGYTFVASGMNYADALAGSVLAGALSSPLVLTDSTIPAPTTSLLGKKLTTLSEVTAFGGTGVVPDSVLQSIKAGIGADGRAVGTDASELKIGFKAGDSETSVTGNLTLPTEGRNGSQIIWISDNPGVVSPEGVVTRPVTSDETVTLTAVVFKGQAIHMMFYEIVVKK